MELNLNGKVAIVTGGALGLGKAICLSLAAEGAAVVVNYISPGEANAAALVKEIESTHGVRALAIKADVSKESEVAEMFDRIEATFSRIDILVNNAGICPICLIKDTTDADWRRTIDINLTGTFLASREIVRRLLAKKQEGRIISIVSPAAFKGSSSGKSHYSASKAGIVGFTVSLAREVAREGITVNALAPGMMYTEMTAATLDAKEDQYRKEIPVGRVGKTSEIADVVTFLASEKAGYITGATLDVSGGLLMR